MSNSIIPTVDLTPDQAKIVELVETLIPLLTKLTGKSPKYEIENVLSLVHLLRSHCEKEGVEIPPTVFASLTPELRKAVFMTFLSVILAVS